MDCCIDGDDGPLDLAAMADLVAVIKGAGAEGSRTGSSVTALRAMKRHLIPRVLSADKAVRCRKVFEALAYFEDQGVKTSYVFRPEELRHFAIHFDLVVDGEDYGRPVRRAAAAFLDLPVIGSISADGGVDISEVSIAFGSAEMGTYCVANDLNNRV